MMSDAPTLAPLIGGVGLLERAVGYLLRSLQVATPAALSNSTPCRDWDVRALLCHVNDSLTALIEAADCGRLDLDVSTGDENTAWDVVTTTRNRASRALGAWTNTDRPLVSVNELPLTSPIVVGAGALELAVHGWDLARGCGCDGPIPPRLATDLLSLSAVLVTDQDRPARFSAPVKVPATACPSDRLVAFLGRDPR
jgi:uncharacterized protein (TIGR03086 family)